MFVKPDKTIKEFELKKGMRVADFGAGAGYFTFPMADAAGNEGGVSAIDIMPTALEAIRGRAKLKGIFNITTIRGDLEQENGSTLEDKSQDRVILASILHQIEDKEAVIKEAKRVLKKNGKIIVVEWVDDSRFGPPNKSRLAPEEVKKLATLAGFTLEKEFEAGDQHYGLVFS